MRVEAEGGVPGVWGSAVGSQDTRSDPSRPRLLGSNPGRLAGERAWLCAARVCLEASPVARERWPRARGWVDGRARGSHLEVQGARLLFRQPVLSCSRERRRASRSPRYPGVRLREPDRLRASRSPAHASAQRAPCRRAEGARDRAHLRAQPNGRYKVTGPDFDGDDLDFVVTIEDGVLIVTLF